jgi:uncharacterized damage-inducible protein DinB
MNSQQVLQELTAIERHFARTTSCLEEADAGFAPAEGMMTAVQQIAHAADTVDWFVEGCFETKGFDTDFEGRAARANAVTSLAEARAWVARAFASAREQFGAAGEAALAAPMRENPFLSGPLYSAVLALTDHTAHHRGALSVYARLRGKVPPMPYMD